MIENVTETRGEKFNESLRTPEIAKSFRADVKKAIAAGELPEGLKVSVRSRSFSGGTSIDVTITAFPGGVLNPAFVFAAELDTHRHQARDFPRYTPAAVRALSTLGAMLDAYLRDASDSRFDHFDVNFYRHVQVSYALEGDNRRALIAGDEFKDLNVAHMSADPRVSAMIDAYNAHNGEN